MVLSTAQIASYMHDFWLHLKMIFNLVDRYVLSRDFPKNDADFIKRRLLVIKGHLRTLMTKEVWLTENAIHSAITTGQVILTEENIKKFIDDVRLELQQIDDCIDLLKNQHKILPAVRKILKRLTSNIDVLLQLVSEST